MKATIYFKNNNLSEFGEFGQFILEQLKKDKTGTFIFESSKVLNRNNLEFITSSLGNDIFFAGTSCENIDNIINKNLPENNYYCGYEVAIITILERPNYWEVTYITHSSNMEYKFFVSDEFNVTELLYNGFSGTIFSHSLVEDVQFSQLIDIESTKKETVESNLFSNCKNLNIIDYLKMKLIYEEGQHRYNYYCPSSPLLYILENKTNNN